MLSEAVAALAAAGGTAVVQAAGTDAWTEFRQHVASWFGRGDPQRQNSALQHLDQTADALVMAEADQVERVSIGHEAAWGARIEDLLEGLDDAEQAQAAEDLRLLLAQHRLQRRASSSQGGPITGTVHVQAQPGSIASGVVDGGVHLHRPEVGHTPPGTENDPDDDWPQES